MGLHFVVLMGWNVDFYVANWKTFYNIASYAFEHLEENIILDHSSSILPG